MAQEKLFRFTVVQQAIVYRDIVIRAKDAEDAFDQYVEGFDADFEIENEEFSVDGDYNPELISDIEEVIEDSDSEK